MKPITDNEKRYQAFLTLKDKSEIQLDSKTGFTQYMSIGMLVRQLDAHYKQGLLSKIEITRYAKPFLTIDIKEFEKEYTLTDDESAFRHYLREKIAGQIEIVEIQEDEETPITRIING